jgi:hypothetical protein
MKGPPDGRFRVMDDSERSPAAAIAGMVLSDPGIEVIRARWAGAEEEGVKLPYFRRAGAN